MKGSIIALNKIAAHKPVGKNNLCLDPGHDFPETERESIKRRNLPDISHKAESILNVRFSARSWVAERANSWQNRFRKLLVRFKKKSGNYLSQVCLAYGIIMDGGS